MNLNKGVPKFETLFLCLKVSEKVSLAKVSNTQPTLRLALLARHTLPAIALVGA